MKPCLIYYLSNHNICLKLFSCLLCHGTIAMRGLRIAINVQISRQVLPAAVCFNCKRLSLQSNLKTILILVLLKCVMQQQGRMEAVAFSNFAAAQMAHTATLVFAMGWILKVICCSCHFKYFQYQLSILKRSSQLIQNARLLLRSRCY